MELRLVHFDGREEELAITDKLALLPGRLVRTFGMGPHSQVYELLTDEGHAGLERVMRLFEGKPVKVEIVRLDVDEKELNDLFYEIEDGFEDLRDEEEPSPQPSPILGEGEEVVVPNGGQASMSDVTSEPAVPVVPVELVAYPDEHVVPPAAGAPAEGVTSESPYPSPPPLGDGEKEDEALDGLVALLGVGEEIAEALYNAGIRSVEDVRAATDKELVDIPGIGDKTLAKIRGQIK